MTDDHPRVNTTLVPCSSGGFLHSDERLIFQLPVTMQEPNNTTTTALSEPTIKISGTSKWIYELREKLAPERREIFDRFLKGRGNIFGKTEAAILKALRWDRSGLKQRVLVEVTAHFNTAGWPSRLGTKTVNQKLKEVEKRLEKEALPKEQRGRFTPAYFIAYRHRKPGHT